MAEQYETLVGYQRAEFAQAARFQGWIIRAQLLLLALTCAAVFVMYEPVLYAIAVISLIVALLWALLNWRFRSSRNVAEKARRATFFMGGMGFELSAHEFREFQMEFTVDIAAAAEQRDPSYFASTQSPSATRMIEMLEEAAFWSAHLLAYSARRYWAFVIGAAVILVLVFVAIAPFLGHVAVAIGAKMFCAMVAALVSVDVLGAALAYSDAASTVRSIQTRVQALKLSGKENFGELLLLISDYNSAVEGAPLFVAGLYDKHHDRLSRLWASSTASQASR